MDGLLEVLGVVGKVILFLPSLLGDGADALGSQGFVQPMPSMYCAPSLQVVPDCDDPGHVRLDWHCPPDQPGGCGYFVEVTWPDSADPRGYDQRKVWAEAPPFKVKAEPQDVVQIVSRDGGCVSMSQQVPFLYERGRDPVPAIRESDLPPPATGRLEELELETRTVMLNGYAVNWPAPSGRRRLERDPLAPSAQVPAEVVPSPFRLASRGPRTVLEDLP